MAKAEKRFTAPTLEEVAQYCRERKNNVDPKKFIEYYEAGGWNDAKGKPVKNWKQKVITWEGHADKKQETGSGNPFLDLLNEWEDENE